ncbi:MAG: hypothetical protein V7637_3071 [Mycobacteriales bacterium]|jgi:hypothetical protein
MADALYGPRGFYTGGAAPGAHFRTSVHASPLFAGAIGELLRRVDAALGHPAPLDLVDVGAGRADLLTAVAAAAGPDLAARLRLTAVERAPRPAGLPGGVRWTAEIPELTGLLIANEWLDNVPVDVVEQTTAGPRLVLVSPAGAESVGGPPGAADAAWLADWWPLRPGQRAEVGRPRDQAWAAAAGQVRRGVAVAIDYAHDRRARPPAGTLTGYRAGRQVPPVPDGSCDLTAHVALDACAATYRLAAMRAAPGRPGPDGPATQLAAPGTDPTTPAADPTGPVRPAPSAAGPVAPGTEPTAPAADTLLTTQRAALRALGVSGHRPPIARASADPAGYLAGLVAAGEAAELTDPGGLGGFGWLVRAVGVPLPLAPGDRFPEDG